ncbi:MAG: hypothetical protein V4664_00400 [Patescibacteria group bacterium]
MRDYIYHQPERPDFSSYYQALQVQVKGDILRESEEQILGSNIEELGQYYYDKYALTPVEIDANRENSWEPQDYLQDVPAQRRDGSYQSEGDLRDMPSQRVVIEVPIIPNKDLNTIAGLSTGSFNYSGRDFRWNTDVVFRTVETKGYQFELDVGQTAKAVKESLESIQNIISEKNQSIDSGNKSLLFTIKTEISLRKQKLIDNKEKVASLTKTIDIPLKKKAGADVQAVRLAHTPLVQRVKPKPTLPEEYEIREEKVNDVITLLDNQARNFEQTPKAIKVLGEEDLRDLLLANLNSVFDGAATGETFSKNGKTDIYLKIDKGNILIAECKIWGGKSLYADTINQLRGYLTWRHNYGIMITFVRNKDFTKTLREVEANIPTHDSYLNGFRKVNETHFVSNHRIDDSEKEVKIHHLFYHLAY